MANRFCDPSDDFQCSSVPFLSELFIPGPQFDIIAPDLEIACPCEETFRTRASITQLVAGEDPYVSFLAECITTNESSCSYYSLTLDIGAPFGGAESILGFLHSKSTGGDWIIYEFVEVIDDPDATPVTYIGGEIQGIAYNEQNIDIPVLPSTTVGPQGDGTGQNQNLDGGIAWTNTTEVAISDNVYATVVLEPGEESQFLLVNDFGFSLPTDAFIISIQIRIEIKSSVNGANITELYEAQGDINIAMGEVIGPADFYEEYDTTPAALGVPDTGAYASNSAFGVRFRVQNGSVVQNTISVDTVEIALTYADELARECVVRLRRGQGDYWLFDYEPRIEIVQIDPEADVVVIDGVQYQPGWLMSYEQSSGDLFVKEDILIRGLLP